MKILALAGLLSPLWMPVPAGSLLLVLADAVAGLARAYAGVRAGLDAALCRRLATMAQGPSMLNNALMQLGMLPAREAGRPSVQRIAGVRRLLRRQALLLAAQAGAIAMAGIWADVACLQPIRRPVVGVRIQDGPVSFQLQCCNHPIGSADQTEGWAHSASRAMNGICSLLEWDVPREQGLLRRHRASQKRG